MTQPDWHDIAERHQLSAAEKQEFFLHANTLAMALNGNITPTIARGAGALMDLPVPGSLGPGQPIGTGVVHANRSFAHIYQQTDGKLRAAMDDLLAAYKAWLKLS